MVKEQRLLMKEQLLLMKEQHVLKNSLDLTELWLISKRQWRLVTGVGQITDYYRITRTRR